MHFVLPPQINSMKTLKFYNIKMHFKVQTKLEAHNLCKPEIKFGMNFKLLSEHQFTLEVLYIYKSSLLHFQM
jgi:hypothetical protein